jgi:hypothetical protein
MIELNVEAKKADLWTPIKSLEEFKKARDEGKRIVWWFGIQNDDCDTIGPTQAYTDLSMKTKIEKYKVCAHQTHRVVIQQGVTWTHPLYPTQKYFKVMCFRSQVAMDAWFDANPQYQKLGLTKWQVIEDPQIAFG